MPRPISRWPKLLPFLLLVFALAMLGPRVCTRTIVDSKLDATKTMMDALATALESFHTDMHRYPSTEEGLAGLRNPDSFSNAGQARWRGPYIPRNFKDAWGEPFEYQCCKSDGHFVLRSHGSGQPMEYSGEPSPHL